MGFDKIFVYMVDKYFLSGEMDYWSNDLLKNNLKERADQLKNSLIGMQAPNLTLATINREPKSIYDLKNTYSVLYFYDPDCYHCKKETPVLKSFYDSTSYDVGVFTISVDTSMQKMSNYIKEMKIEDWVNTNGTQSYDNDFQKLYDALTTPTIYLLNEKKEIIAKKIAAKQLEEVITNYENMKNN